MNRGSLVQDMLDEVSSRIISFQIRLHLLITLVKSSEYFRFIESLRTCIMASHKQKLLSQLLYGSSVNQETESYRTSVIDIPAKLFTNTRCKTVTSLCYLIHSIRLNTEEILF